METSRGAGWRKGFSAELTWRFMSCVFPGDLFALSHGSFIDHTAVNTIMPTSLALLRGGNGDKA